MILDTIIEEHNHKTNETAQFNELQICQNCGKKMVDNTFMRGSRLAGSFNCDCGSKIFF